MQSHEGPFIAAALAQQVRGGATAEQVATSVVATWNHAEACLTPIIGPQGMAALYKRSLVLAGRSHPWLAALHDTPSDLAHLERLRTALMQQERSDAARSGGEILETFYGLVNGLIGPSLTHRLLRSMWQTF